MKKMVPTDQQEKAITQVVEESTGATLCAAAMGVGKAQPISEPVLTSLGWKPMGEIKLGDTVIGSDGLPTEVLGVFPQGEQEIVRVTLSDGSSTRTTWDHLWSVRKVGRNKSWVTMSTRQMVNEGLHLSNGQRRFSVPLVEPVEFENTGELPLDPYLVGVLLGDGGLTTNMPMLSTDQEIIDNLVLPPGVSITHAEGCNYRVLKIKGYLEELGMLGARSEEKEIPTRYLHAKSEARHALLQGLFDTDGSPVASGTGVEYGTTSKILAEQVIYLVQSMGGIATKTTKVPAYTYKGEKKEGKKFYRIYVRYPHPPFRLSRKKEKNRPYTKYPPSRKVDKVETVGREEAQCIKVAAKDSLYVTKDFIVTHNTLIAVESALRLGTEVLLIVCPLNTRTGWERTLRLQGWEHPIHRVDSKKAGKAAYEALKASEPGAYLVGREYFRRLDWDKVKPDFTVVDEVHFAQNRKTKSFEKLRSLKHGRKLALSATPFRNRFEGAWTVTRWLWPDKVDRSFWRWAAVWGKMEYDPFSRMGKKMVGESKPGAYVASLPSYIYLESDIAEPLTEVRHVELNRAQRKHYNEMENEALTWLGDNPMVATLSITQRIRLRQMTLGVPTVTWYEDPDTGERKADVTFDLDTPSAKIDALKDIIKDLDDDEPVLILLGDSERFADVVVHRLGDKAVKFTGKTPQRKREEILETFGKPGGPVYLVATVPTISEGVDGLQHVCNTVVWLSKSEDGILNEQASGRLARTGQTKPVHSYEIVAEDTYDENILSKLIQDELDRRETLRGKSD